MKKLFLLISFLLVVGSVSASGRRNISDFTRGGNRSAQSAAAKTDKTDAVYKSISQQYADGKISADSVVNLALYHKVWSRPLAERCLQLVADKSPRAAMELGVLYAFSPEYAAKASEGVKLLESSAKVGYNDANCYLGLYNFNHNDYKTAKSYFDACSPMNLGIGYAALGGMYIEGKGVNEDPARARENYRQSALKGYPRGMALYGFNLRASAAGKISYPDSFFWLYIAGDLGDDAARTILYLPERNEFRGESETANKAKEALQWIRKVQSGKKIQNEQIYREGFLPSLKDRELAAEQGDDWARFYLGSMNYNGDFLNQNYKQVIHYYEPIARNGKLPANLLALVNERLAEIYRDGKGTEVNTTKAAEYARKAAQYGSLPAYLITENIN
ncbi:MAG: sel1 repeat family protein [Paramuribaculum sp.]|nr:sel1 repeat family protein [Paramuribaculum sp.]MDE6303312.1 sel1 repeat family protein [Paramuribaculum sp.]